MWPHVSARLVRNGFYPRGGGRIEVEIELAPLAPIDCVVRGALRGVSAQALCSGLPSEIPQRMIKRARKDLPDWAEEGFAVC